jgi:hypothetical protein
LGFLFGPLLAALVALLQPLLLLLRRWHPLRLLILRLLAMLPQALPGLLPQQLRRRQLLCL